MTKAASLFNYNIKSKHAAAMSNFLQSKNFEIKTRMPTPRKHDKVPVPEKIDLKGKTSAHSKKGSVAKGRGSKAKEVPIVVKEESMDKKRGSISSVDSEIAKNFVCSENIEVSDIEEL